MKSRAWRVLTVVVVLAALTMLTTAPVLAGYRETFSSENTPNPWGNIITTRYINGLWAFRIYACRKTPGTDGIISFQYKTASDPSFTEYGTLTISSDTYQVHTKYIVASGSLENMLMWKIIVSGSSPGGIKFWWYEVCDVYGDPAYDSWLLEPFQTSLDSYLPLVTTTYVTDTITGTQGALVTWGMDRSFSWDGVMLSVSMVGAALLFCVAQAFRVFTQ